jgi:hypothetical protein
MTLLRLIPLGLALCAPALADGVTALRDGEAYTYRVSWGPFGGAGEIKVAAAKETADGVGRLRITTHTSTRGMVRLLFPFDGSGDSLFDLRDGRLLAAQATTQARKERTQASIVFDYAQAKASYTDYVKPKRSATLALPDGQLTDFITSLIQARSWNLVPGQSHEAVVLFDNEFYTLNITAERIETVETAHGKKSALLLVPRMIGTPKGMFRKGGEVHVWISDDDARLPVRFEVRLPVGTAVALLTEHREPAAKVARLGR